MKIEVTDDENKNTKSTVPIGSVPGTPTMK